MKPADLHCQVCGQLASGVFCSLAGAHLDKLDREKTVQHYQRGQGIFYEGHSATAIYCVYSGRVKLYKVGRKDEETLIRLLGPGDLIGYRPLLANEPYAATAEAVEDSILCVLSKETVSELLHDCPELALSLLAKLARELRTSEEQMLSILQESVSQRTARVLLWLFEQGGKNAGVGPESSIPMHRIELAQMIGTTPETLSRILHQFAARGIIELTRKSIKPRNIHPLNRLAKSGKDELT
jgi:CRP-like cAMP-binding protein